MVMVRAKSRWTWLETIINLLFNLICALILNNYIAVDNIPGKAGYLLCLLAKYIFVTVCIYIYIYIFMCELRSVKNAHFA